MLQFGDVQVHVGFGVRPRQQRVLPELVPVRAIDAGVSPREGCELRYCGDVHRLIIKLSRGPFRTKREELWVGRLGMREWAMYVFES